MKWILYSDGASRGNPGKAGAGALLINAKGEEYPMTKYLGLRTNNQAEYEGLILGLEKAQLLHARHIEIRADSELLVKQLLGEYRVKNAALKTLFDRAKNILNSFDQVKILHIPREENSRADSLSNEAIDFRCI